MAMEQKARPESFIDMYKRLADQLHVPDIDFQAIIDAHRKNLETLEKTANTSSAGASAMMAKQREILEETLRDIAQMAEKYRTPGTPQEIMARQADFVSRSFEQAVQNTNAIADLMKKSTDETLEVLRERIRQGMKEIRESYESRQ
jgi:phasin family protein